MRSNITFFIGMLIFSAFSVDAQTRTVTNADLSKFREKRLQSEREYRENYERMGFPSPEELELQRAESRREREELAERLRLERLEREQFESTFRSAYPEAPDTVIYFNAESGGSRYVYGYPASWYRGRRSPFPGYRGRNPIGWRATPAGVIYTPGGRSSNTWSPSVTSRPRPAFRQP
ncbi:hypothetical protein BH24ACI3_BH24ACI3_04510 [soil metagenome]